MTVPTIDSDEFDEKMERLRLLAEELYEAVRSLYQISYRSFLDREGQGSKYGSKKYHRLYAVREDFLRFRLALLWDIFPQRRTEALRFCQDRFTLVSSKLTERLDKKARAALPSLGFELLGQASILFDHPDNITTAQFAKGVVALAECYTLFVVSTVQDDEYDMVNAFHQGLLGPSMQCTT